MYKIFSDEELIYDPSTDGYNILDGQVKLELNTSGTLIFTVPKTNPSYGRIKLMKSIVTLYDGERLLFRGRAFAPSVDLFNNDKIECEGELAFFNDTIQEPFNFVDTDIKTVLKSLIGKHNAHVDVSKQFRVGNINVEHISKVNVFSGEYCSTWQVLRDKILKPFGGYFWLRHEDTGTCIDYFSELDFIGRQQITKTINLVDASKQIMSDTLATSVIPLGAKLQNENGEQTNQRLTIAGLNNNSIALTDVNATGIYGHISKTVIHDDITDVQQLLDAGKKDLATALGVDTVVVLKAVDLSKAGYNISPFMLGSHIHVKVDNLGIDKKMLISSMSLDLLKPETNTITVGRAEKTLTFQHQTSTQSINKIFVDVTENISEQTNAAVVRAVREANSNIEQSVNEIRSEVSESFYDKEHANELLEQVYTAIKQSAEGIEFSFGEYQQTQEELNASVQARFKELVKYIRFIDGNILLGQEENPLTLRIENDQISFMENGSVIAYWRNRKFYAVDGEFINSLRLGKFAFIPRASGNLSFTKVVN